MSNIAARRRNPREGARASPSQALPSSAPKNKSSGGTDGPRKWNGFMIVGTLLLVLVLGKTSSPSENSNLSFLKELAEEETETSGGSSADESERTLQDQQASAPADELVSIDRFDLDSADAVGSGSRVPVLLRGWEAPQLWKQNDFLSKVGHFHQYLKDEAVQPFKDGAGELCRLPGTEIAQLMMKRTDKELLFFTNNKENEPFMKDLESAYQVPSILAHIDGFQVFSAVAKGRSHSFHKHGESWLGQVEGRRMWWFLPPTVDKPDRINACEYIKGTSKPPAGSISCMQEPGDIIWFPKDWFHATCSLDDWSVGIGAQIGPLIRQQFTPLNQSATAMTDAEAKAKAVECLGPAPVDESAKDWTWFDGDLNAYYNSLEKDHNRDPTRIASYAVHRWMGPKRTTEEHYRLLYTAVNTHHKQADSTLQVFDGGCGLGSGLMWMEKNNPAWDLTGHTISEEQYKFITQKLPEHKFHVNLQSYNELDKDFDFMYSIEALIHSADVTKTFEEWAIHLNDGGIIAIIDDFLAEGASKDDEEVVAFAKSWLANSLFTPTELGNIGRQFGLTVVENRDLTVEYRVNELNYKNKKPDISPDKGKTHQGWMGSKWRQRLSIEGKLTYNLMVFKKAGSNSSRTLTSASSASYSTSTSIGTSTCEAIPSKLSDSDSASFNEITPQLMSGKGKNGGNKMQCISSWYCCNKGHEWWDKLNASRTDDTPFLKLPRDLFGHYIDSFAKHLNKHYQNYPIDPNGRFLDIGGTGSTASGMKQVTSKFQHFAGPLEYWILDSDPGAKELNRTLYCDIDDCPAADTCGFDVTFSHTVLEHASRPWKTFDTISRITKKGGLTMHLVPFSYQYHATPDDNYRFSHKALTSLLEDRGFTVLEVGYDICMKQEKMLRRVDEHYDEIWLTYVIGRKD